MVAIRRDIHAHPEIGHAEHRTTGVIVDELERAGLVAKVLPVGTGAYCDVLPNGTDYADGLVGIRADIDALPDHRRQGRAYASQNPGRLPRLRARRAHHDRARRSAWCWPGCATDDLLPRGVRLIFQPAEETSPGGALDAIDGGVLQDLTEIYALHCDPRTDVGQIALKVGPITSAVDQVTITLTGIGGHTSRPHLTQDIVGALGALATTTQLVLSRRVDPRSGVSLMWGSIHAGSVANAIPGTGQIVGTLRALDVAGWQHAKQLIPQLAAEIVRPFGVEVEVAVTDGVPPAVNHASGDPAADPGQRARCSGRRRWPVPSSRWAARTSPGCCSRCRVRWPGSGSVRPGKACPDIHQPTFLVDEACIAVGLKVLAEVATTH